MLFFMRPTPLPTELPSQLESTILVTYTYMVITKDHGFSPGVHRPLRWLPVEVFVKMRRRKG